MAEADRQETFESIPWERLLADPRERRRRIMTLAALGLAVLAVSSSLARSLWPVPAGSGGSPTTIAAATLSPAQSTVPMTTVASLPSEADLMAVGASRPAGGSPEGLAGWFLSAYFGSDPAAAEMLSSGLELPAVESGVRSFVDSVHVLSTRFADDSVTVVAAVRTLVDLGDGFRRPDPLVVEVDLEATDDGWAVAGPPRPVGHVLPRLEQTWESVPDEIAALARESASGFGEPVTVGPGRSSDSRWSVVVTVDLGAAGVWPLLIDVPSDTGDR